MLSMLLYIVILNVRLDNICVKHQQVFYINSWDNGMWQYIIFFIPCVGCCLSELPVTVEISLSSRAPAVL